MSLLWEKSFRRAFSQVNLELYSCEHLSVRRLLSSEPSSALHLTQGDCPSAQGPTQSALVSFTFTLTHSVPDTQTSSLFLKHARHSPASSFCKDHSFYKYLCGLLPPTGLCSNPLSRRAPSCPYPLKRAHYLLCPPALFLFSILIVLCCCFWSHPLEGMLHHPVLFTIDDAGAAGGGADP